MKKSGFTESRISAALKEYESGGRAEDICRELGLTPTQFITGKRGIQGWTLRCSDGIRSWRRKMPV